MLQLSHKQAYEIARWVNYSIVSPYLSESYKDKPMTELFPLTTDEDAKPQREYKEETAEEVAQMQQKAQQIGELLQAQIQAELKKEVH